MSSSRHLGIRRHLTWFAIAGVGGGTIAVVGVARGYGDLETRLGWLRRAASEIIERWHGVRATFSGPL